MQGKLGHQQTLDPYPSPLDFKGAADFIGTVEILWPGARLFRSLCLFSISNKTGPLRKNH